MSNYSKQEQKQIAKSFEESVERARKDWNEYGIPYIILSYQEYLKLVSSENYGKLITKQLDEIKKLVKEKF